MPPKSGSPLTFSGTLSLRLALFFVPVLVSAAVIVGILFDRGRVEALKGRELEALRSHAERAADELARYVRNLQRDALFLAGTPPVLGIARALTANGLDPVGRSTLAQWQGRLQQIFLAFAATRSEYFQLRLIGLQDDGRELVRVERSGGELRVTPEAELQKKSHRYYMRNSAQLSQGATYLSRIDLNREHGEISIPHQPTLRVVTAVYDDIGDVFGVVVVNMDMQTIFERMLSLLDADEQLYIADAYEDFLLHPDPSETFGSELGKPHRLRREFPLWTSQLAGLSVGQGTFLSMPDNPGTPATYASVRALAPQNDDHRVTILLTKSNTDLFEGLGMMRKDHLLAMIGLLLLASILVVLISRRMTSSLQALASTAKAIAQGQYHVTIPDASGGEAAQLTAAFRQMVDEVQRREHQLTELNQQLETRVEERTRKIADQRLFQKLIIDSIGDGIVVTDRKGRFLLWNRKAEQIVGAGPEPIPPEQWSTHFGIFRSESGDEIPVDELPLVRAMRGISSDSVELFLRPKEDTEGRWVQVTARPLFDAHENLIGGVAAMLDITEKKRLEARLEEHHAELQRVGRLALSAEIAASAAHHLSQPLAALGTYAEVLSQLNVDQGIDRKRLTVVLDKIESLAARSGEVLDQVRALVRRRQAPLAVLDVNVIVTASIDGFKDRLERHHIGLELEFTPDLPKIRGDAIELEQAIIQMLSNALEALKEVPREQRLLCARTGQDRQRTHVVIEIEDTGPGVSAALVGRLFEPWETSKKDALGLGLSIAQRIIEAHRGRIAALPGRSRGALFRIEIPTVDEAGS